MTKLIDSEHAAQEEALETRVTDQRSGTSSGASSSRGASSLEPGEILRSLQESPKTFSFDGEGMTGAEVFAQLCKEENLSALFCAPGNYAIIHALAASGITTYGGRTEGSMCSAADGFYRASGEVAACSGTEGPGFAHMIMGIGAASAARTPLLVLASNSRIDLEDREMLIQNIYQQPLTQGLKKFGKRIITPSRVYEYGAYAFRNLKSGVPGPVHLDFPKEVSESRFTDPKQLTDYFGKSRYRSESTPAPSSGDILQVVEIIENAKRPVLIAGHGVFHRNASEALLQLAERNELAVVVSGPNRGHFPDDHRLSMNLSPGASKSADLVIFVGQYCMPSPAEYQICDTAQTIRVHPVAEELGRNWPLDLGIVSDERTFLEMLAEKLPARSRSAWVQELGAARRAYEEELESHYALGLKYSDTGKLHPAVIGHELYKFFFDGDIDPRQTVTGWGGFTSQRFVPPRLRAYRPGQSVITMYQFGATGVSVPMMVGAAAAVKEGIGAQREYKGAPVLVYCSDADMAYGMFELETAVKYKIPLIAVVYNNDCWGSWITSEGSPRSLHLHLFMESIRYDQMAEKLGVHGEYVRSQEELRTALQRSYNIAVHQSLPSLINVQAVREFTSNATHPPGFGLPPEPSIGSHYH